MRGVIFDLDGTLLDTLGDIAAAANAALAELGHPVHSESAYRQFIGGGVSVLFSRALPEGARSAEQIERAVTVFRARYARGWAVHSAPYPGIAELLERVASAGTRMAILSNKPHDFTVECVSHFFPDAPFSPVLGQHESRPAKPSPQAALEITATWGGDPGEVAFVGDSGVDMETARRAGMVAIGVTWGFRSRQELLEAGAERLAENPESLLELIKPVQTLV